MHLCYITSLHEKSLVMGLESLMRDHNENEEDKQSSLSQGGLGRAGSLRPKHLHRFLVCKEKFVKRIAFCLFVFPWLPTTKRYYLGKLFRTRAVWREDSSLFCSLPGFSPSQKFIESEQPLHIGSHSSIFHKGKTSFSLVREYVNKVQFENSTTPT